MPQLNSAIVLVFYLSPRPPPRYYTCLQDIEPRKLRNLQVVGVLVKDRYYPFHFDYPCYLSLLSCVFSQQSSTHVLVYVVGLRVSFFCLPLIIVLVCSYFPNLPWFVSFILFILCFLFVYLFGVSSVGFDHEQLFLSKPTTTHHMSRRKDSVRNLNVLKSFKSGKIGPVQRQTHKYCAQWFHGHSNAQESDYKTQ